MRLIAIINMTKIKKCLGLPGIIHASKLTINLYNKTQSNYQYDKNKKVFKLIKNYLYNKIYSDY